MLRRGILALITGLAVLVATPSTTSPILPTPPNLPEPPFKHEGKDKGRLARKTAESRCYVIATDSKLLMMVSICLTVLPVPKKPQPDPES